MILFSQGSCDLSYKKVVGFFYNLFQERRQKIGRCQADFSASAVCSHAEVPCCRLVSIDTCTDCLTLMEEGREAPRLGTGYCKLIAGPQGGVSGVLKTVELDRIPRVSTPQVLTKKNMQQIL